jgi:peptide/nickel transport system permease protein
MPAERVTQKIGSRHLRQMSARRGPSQVLAALLRDKLVCFAALFLGVIAFCAVLAPFIAPYSPLSQALMSRLLPPGSFSPSGFHLLGTDELGRDILSRLMYGSRVTLAVAAAAVLVSGVLGTLTGLIAGYCGGWIDSAIMRAVDLMMAVPLLLLALVLLYVFGASLQNVIIVLGIVRWPTFARMSRASTMSIKQEDYVLAAYTIGGRPAHILFKHVLPNILTPLFVLITLEAAANILTESTLSFLGMGVQLPNASWGLMLASAREYMLVSPWLIAIPGVSIFITVLSINVFGMWLRSLSDPLHRWRMLTGKVLAKSADARSAL